MQKPKLDVLVAMLAYGGNGGVATVLPNHATWLASTSVKAERDDRIGRFDVRFYGDVPLSMERNRIVRDAMDGGYDAILMIDSDNEIDGYVGAERDAKPFWDSSIGFLYERELRGLPTVVCAPYCGPPPHPVNGGAENVYVFYVDDFETLDPGQPNGGWKVVPYSRQHAATMRGIQPIAAGPTGVILYSTSAFRVLPESVAPEEVLEKYRKGELHLERAKQLLDRKSWFYYEYTDAARSRKASTEDVTSTREIQLAGCIKYGEPIVFCNWDSWAMHLKPKRVGKPNVLPIEAVSQAFQEVVRDNVSVDDNRVMLDLPDLPEHDPTLGGRLHLVKKNGHDFMHVGFVSNQDDLAVIEGLIQKLDMPVPVGVEIGSWVGDSATTIASTHKDLWVKCVDTFKGSGSDQTHLLFKDLVKTTGDDDILFNTFCDNVEPYKGRIAPYRATSAEAAEVFEDFSLDFAYIDAGHNYEECLEDIKLWLPKIKAGGLIFGHDHCEHFPGVIKACKEMFGDDYDVEGTVWWHWVPATGGQCMEEPEGFHARNLVSGHVQNAILGQSVGESASEDAVEDFFDYYRPGSKRQEDAHRKSGSMLILSGDRRAGKTTCAAAIFASRVLGRPVTTVDGQQIDSEWPVSTIDDPQQYAVIGHDAAHTDWLYRLLFENGGVGAGLPMIPASAVVDMHNSNSDRRLVKLTNGAEVYFWPSSLTIPGGDGLSGVWIDEDLTKPSLPEIVDRLVDREGWFVWSSWDSPQVQSARRNGPCDFVYLPGRSQQSALDEANEVVILGRKFVDPVIAPEEAATINALCDVDEFATVLAVSERAEIAWAALSGREGKAAFWATSNAASAVALALAPGRTLQCSLLKSLERIEAAVLVIDTESEIPQEALRHVANKGKIVAISKEPLGEPFVHVAGSIYVGKKERVTQSVDD
jgi:hypothetical protein